jgi:hypothetical protein
MTRFIRREDFYKVKEFATKVASNNYYNNSINEI